MMGEYAIPPGPIGYGHLVGIPPAALWAKTLLELAVFARLAEDEAEGGVTHFDETARRHPEEAGAVIGALQAFCLRMEMERTRGAN
jgi:hypothetical protein